MPSDYNTQYVLSTRSHVKLVMHCMKYPHATMTGLLLSPSKSSGEGNRVKFVDVIPLFHLGHGLSPMLEVALLQVSGYCKQRNLVISGLYHATKTFHDSTPDIFAQRTAEKIWEQNNQSILLSVDNVGLAKSLMEETNAESSLHPFSFSDSKWKLRTGVLKLENGSHSFECMNELILNQGLQLRLNDFDNHLDDISSDWTNKALNEKITKFIESLDQDKDEERS